MTGLRSAPKLHLNCDIPVVEIEGEWDEVTDRTISEIVAQLMHAGHFDIIVNLSRMSRTVLFDRMWLDTLERMAADIRSHFGRLDIVGTVEQVQQAVRKRAQSRILWATSEEEAVGRMKGLSVWRSGPILTMRLTK